MFGENLTTLGLDEHGVWIGERFQVGQAVFVVTLPELAESLRGYFREQPGQQY